MAADPQDVARIDPSRPMIDPATGIPALPATPEDQQRLTSELRVEFGETREPGIQLQGPNAQEAETGLEGIRQMAGTPSGQPLPSIYRSMAQARAAGFGWNEIDDTMAAVRSTMGKQGYTNDEINNYFYGAPIDSKPSQFAPQATGGREIPDAMANKIRGLAMDFFGAGERGLVGPGNMIAASGLPAPGEMTGNGLLKSIGWNAVDFAKTFGSSMLNAVGAVSEMFDGKDRDKWEWAKLGWEAAPLVPLFGKAALESSPVRNLRAAGALSKALDAGEPVLPRPQEFLDGATAIASYGPPEEFDERVAASMRALGDAYAKVKEPPVSIAANHIDQIRVNAGASIEEHLAPIRALGGQDIAGSADTLGVSGGGAVAPLTAADRVAMAARRTDDLGVAQETIAAQDRALPPGRVPTAQPEAQTFQDFLSDESGAIKLPQMNIEPEKLYQRDPEIGKDITRDVKSIFSPYSLAPNSAELLAANRARGVLETERAMGNLVRFGRAVGDLSTPERWDFTDTLEAHQLPGSRWDGTTMGDLGKQLRLELDHVWTKLDQRGIAPGYVEDYLPHIYADPVKARRWLSQGGTLAGPKTFTKERMFGSYAEARQAGLPAATDNPIHMAVQTIRQGNQYAAAWDSVQELLRNNVLKALGPNDPVPPDFGRINGRLGITGAGTLYAPRPVAALVNSLVDPGFGQYSLYRLARDASTSVFRTKLALSGFHAFFVTADAINSSIALAAQQISRGAPEEIAQGIKTLVTAPGAPIRNYMNGKQLGDVLMGTASVVKAADQKIADLFIQGGGRVNIEPDYQGSAYGSFLNALKGTFVPSSGRATLGQEVAQLIRDAQPVKWNGTTVIPSLATASFQLLTRTLDTVTAPLMEHLVPTLKRGVFYQGMTDYLRVNPQAGEAELRHYAFMLNRSIDNRLGEMVYDNRFWNKYARDAAQLAYPALGWHAGTLAELGGGAKDLLGGRSQVAGQYNQITQRASYVIGMAVGTALMSATAGVMYGTWNENWTPRDYMAPPTGGKDKYGNPERLLFRGYHKDAYELLTDPGHYAGGGLNPLGTMLYDAANNQQWNGATITDPKANLLTNLDDYANWFVKNAEPISLDQIRQPEPGSNIGTAERFFGLRPAPMAIQDPDVLARIKEREERQAIHKMNKMKQQQ